MLILSARSSCACPWKPQWDHGQVVEKAVPGTFELNAASWAALAVFGETRRFAIQGPA